MNWNLRPTSKHVWCSGWRNDHIKLTRQEEPINTTHTHTHTHKEDNKSSFLTAFGNLYVHDIHIRRIQKVEHFDLPEGQSSSSHSSLFRRLVYYDAASKEMFSLSRLSLPPHLCRSQLLWFVAFLKPRKARLEPGKIQVSGKLCCCCCCRKQDGGKH
jgi:hypothetical protein